LVSLILCVNFSTKFRLIEISFSGISKTGANKKVAIKLLLFAANQVVFLLWIGHEGYSLRTPVPNGQSSHI
jgi:hypothetical protein